VTVQADSPVLYYRFREASAVPATNIVTLGSAATGTYQYGTTLGVAGPRPAPYPGFEAGNDAVYGPGTGPSVLVPALNLNTNTVTITGWIKPSTLPESVFGGIVVCDARTTHAGLTMDLHGTGVGYVWNNDPNTYNWSPSSNSGLPLLAASDWSYVALVVKADQAAIYLCASNNPANFAGVTNFPSGGHALQAFDGATLIGSDAGHVAYSFAGDIDEVAVFNRALGEGELYSQYASAVGGLGPLVFSGPSSPIDGLHLGDTVKLTADAGGAPLLSYQWQFDGTNIAGATASSLTLTNVQPSQVGNYLVIVSNAWGVVSSSTVIPPRTATANAVVVNGFVVSATITDGGFGYTNTPTVKIIGGGGSGAQVVAVLSNGVVIAVNVIDAGYGYTSTPLVVLDPRFIPNPVLDIAPMSFLAFSNLTLGGVYQLQQSVRWYWSNQPVSQTATTTLYTQMVAGVADSGDYRLALNPVPAQAFATAQVVNGFVVGATVTSGGSGYVTSPAVTTVGAGGTNATAVSHISGGVVTSITIVDAGNGYTNAPTVRIAPPPAAAVSPTVLPVMRVDSANLAPYDDYQIQFKSDIGGAWGNWNGGLFSPTELTNSQYLFITNSVGFFRLQYVP
jgi:hypothetical protein